MGSSYEIDKCSQCGKRLERRRWIVGLCKACEAEAKRPEKPLQETGKTR